MQSSTHTYILRGHLLPVVDWGSIVKGCCCVCSSAPRRLIAFQTLPLEAYKNLVVPIGQPAHWVRQPKKLAVVLAQTKVVTFFCFSF